MARVDLSEVIQNIRGSVKNHTFSCWKGRNFLRQKAVSHSNPCSPVQQTIRAALGAISKMWHADLSSAQRAGWDELAQELKAKGEKLGPNSNGGAGSLQLIPDYGGVMSGYNAFVQHNFAAFEVGAPMFSPPVPNAPLGITPPNAPTDLAFFAYCRVGAVPCSVYLTWTNSLDAPVGTITRIWAYSHVAGVHKQVVVLSPLAPQMHMVTYVKGALGAVFPIQDLPGPYYFQADAVTLQGLRSPSSNTITVDVVPTCDECPP